MDIDAVVSQLIADDHARPLTTSTRRRAELPWLPRKADAVIGMRRTGKTTLLRQIVADRVDAGVPRESLLYINFEDERLWPLDGRSLGVIVDVFYRRYPHLRDRECTFLFDEIQVVDGWERFVRRLLDTENVHICVSGSSAKLLSRELATSLRGRCIATELFPFSFDEYLSHHEIDAPQSRHHPNSKQRSHLENALDGYLQRGGFPEIQQVTEPLRTRVLQEYLDVVILRDVIERHAVSNTVALRRLTRQILNAPAALFSVSRFYNDLRSQGIRVSKNTLHALLDHLSDAYFALPVPIHTSSERVRQSNPRKLYSIDPGLITACAFLPGRGIGQLLETFVLLHLRRQTTNISYYRNHDGTEVDFVVQRRDRLELVQACASLSAAETRSRELHALDRAMADLRIDHATIVTLHDDARLDCDSGTVAAIPAWRWALSLDPATPS